MKLLFTLDGKNYDEGVEVVYRPSARGIVIRGDKVAMIHSKKYDYYKFPGGGIEEGESPLDAMMREVREEGGLVVLPETVREFGNVHRRSITKRGGLFIQDNYYFTCSCDENIREQILDDYESDEGFTLEFVTPEEAIAKNRAADYGKMPFMLEREARVLELLIKEGYFEK
jgi:8-oxo-dGTP pyrophosphatase MutT (NUDIX family)